MAYHQANRNAAQCGELLRKSHATVADYKRALREYEASQQDRLLARKAIKVHRTETSHRVWHEPSREKHTLNAATRESIAAAQRKRWAEYRKAKS